MKLAAILVATAALGFPGAAVAFPFDTLPAPPSFAQASLGIAAQYWHAYSDCPNGISVYTSDLKLFGWDGVTLPDDRCSMWLDYDVLLSIHDTDARVHWCSIVVHEFGHNLGVPHNTRVDSIMHSPISDSYEVWGCYQRFKKGWYGPRPNFTFM